MDAFHDWQAARAAARAGAAVDDGPAAAEFTRVAAAAAEPLATAGVEAGAPMPGGASDYSLPSPPTFPDPAAPPHERRAHVEALLSGGVESRRLAIEFAREVLRQVPSSELQDAGATQLGDADVEEGDEGAEHPEEAAAAAGTPRRFQVDLHSRQPLPFHLVTYQGRCLCCDDDVGRGVGGQCSALQLLATLEDEMAERDRIIDRELDGGDDDWESHHRNARKFMYRAFVAAKYGHLGKGNRVRLPDCVVAAIRARYRAPGCDCAVCDLAACRVHGYAGYKAS